MEKLKANIFKGDKLLFENITVHISESIDHAGIKDWYGVFNISLSEHIDPGGPYRIELEDGRIGAFIVSDIRVDFNNPTEVYFIASGPLI